MNPLPSFPLILAVALFVSCGSKKNMSQNELPELNNAVGFVKKVYPGVSGDVRYFDQYRVEFDLKTSGEVQFNSLVVHGDTLRVSAVRVGNKIINTSTGEHLSASTQNVRIHASKPVKQQPNDLKAHSGDTQQMVVSYTFKNKTYQYAVDDIRAESDEHRPGVGPSPGNRE